MKRRDFLKGTAVVGTAATAGLPSLANAMFVDSAILEQRRQAEELWRCENDVKYFLENYFYIQHPVKGKTLIELNYYQHTLLEATVLNKLVVSSAARQVGKTSANAGRLLHKALFTPNSKILVVGHKRIDTLEILSQLTFGYDNLPEWFPTKYNVKNKGHVELDNRSYITTHTSILHGTHSRSITDIYVDEAAYFTKSDELSHDIKLVRGIMPHINIVLTSTPNGPTGYFADLHRPFKTGFHVMKPYKRTDEAFIAKMQKMIGELRTKQQFLADWV